MVMSLSRVLWKVRSKAPTVTASVQGTVSVTGEGYTTIRDSTVTGPHQVFWKVKNNGSEALDAQQPRGQVEEGSSSRYESTSYVGSHYVEVYIVQNNVCVAMSRQPVIIQPR